MRLHSVHQDSGSVDPLSWYHFHINEPHEPTRSLSVDPRGSSSITLKGARRASHCYEFRAFTLRSRPNSRTSRRSRSPCESTGLT